LKGRVKREAVFREPIQLKLDGLPQGVTLAAPLKPLPPEQNEFQIELRSDPKTGVAAANLSLTCSATINAMVYLHPALTIALQGK